MSVPPPPPRRRAAPDSNGTPTGGAVPPPPPPPDRQAREQRRAEERTSSQRRWWLTVVAGVLAIALIAVAVVVVSSGSKQKKPTFKASTSVDLKLGDLSVASVTGTGTLDADTGNLLLKQIGNYVEEGVVRPLRKGKADETKLDPIFDLAALSRLKADRAVLLDEGLPKAVGEVKITAPPVNMLGLSSGLAFVAVSTSIDLDIRARTTKGTVTIHRKGTLVFEKSQSGQWVITGWTLHVDRAGPGVEVTTSTAPATTTTAAAQ